MLDNQTAADPAGGDDRGDDLRSVLSSAFDDFEPPEPERVESTPEPASPNAPGDRPRDERGRFTSSTLTDEPHRAAPAESPSPTEPTEPPAAPKAWSDAASWQTLPRDAQERILAREGDVEREASSRTQQLKEAEALRAVLEPHRAKHAMMGLSDAEAIQRLLLAEQALRTNPAQAFPELARAYGFDLRQLQQPQASQFQPQYPPSHGPQDIDKYVDGRMREIFRERELATQQQQVASSIEAFASDPKHPHFEAVRLHMGALIQAGAAKDLPDAYEQAVWANPTIRAQVQAEQAKADEAKRQTEARAKADAARRAGVSVRGSPVGGTASQAPADSIRAEIERAYGA